MTSIDEMKVRVAGVEVWGGRGGYWPPININHGGKSYAVV